LSVVPRALLVACAAVALAAPSAALAHQGNPNYLSQVRGLSPSLNGLSVEVLNRDDRLLLHNTSGHTVIVDGYSDEPYARIDGDGTVSVNTDSQAYYLNEERDGQVEVPPDADSKGEPRWKQISRSGRFEFSERWRAPSGVLKRGG
jgi:hypothetical protein